LGMGRESLKKISGVGNGYACYRSTAFSLRGRSSQRKLSY